MQWTISFMGALLAACSGAKPDPSTADTGDLSYEAFRDELQARYCEEQDGCNPDVPCDTDNLETPPDPCSSFDPEVARDCLEGEWTCNTDSPGFEYPEPPEPCERVCGS